MADSPAADVSITADLIRTLLRAEALSYAEDPIELVSTGWDNEVWRLGPSRAVRMPRRAIAAQLILNEQHALPHISKLLQPAAVLVPEPLHRGTASAHFERAWSVVPWFAGTAAISVPRAERSRWAAQLAGALELLHVAASADAPVNTFRGVPLSARDEVIRARSVRLNAAPALTEAWDVAIAAGTWSGPNVWIHGDLHPGNIVVDQGRLSAIVDFGDVTSGDPAYDLAAAWIVFDDVGRARFMETLDSVDPDTWRRARGWAAAVAMILLESSDDKPEYATLGEEIVAELGR